MSANASSTASEDPMVLLQHLELGAALLEVMFAVFDADDALSARNQDRTPVVSSIFHRSDSTGIGGKKVGDEERFIQDQARVLYVALQELPAAVSPKIGMEKLHEHESLLCLLALSIFEQAQSDDHAAAMALNGGRDLPAVTKCQGVVENTRFLSLVGEGDMQQNGSVLARYERVIGTLLKQCDVDDNRESFAWRNTGIVLDKTHCQILVGHQEFNVLFESMKISYEKSLKLPAPVLDWGAQWWDNGKALGDGMKRVECVGCCDTFAEIDCLRATCDHYFCEVCVATLVSISIKDEACFPMKCCKQPMKPADISPFLDESLRLLYTAACLEFGLSPERRVYCPRPKCSAFLGPAAGPSVQCRACSISVCTKCKEVAHPGESCAESKALEKTKKLAAEQLWRSCPKCKAIIEKTEGCNHMVCRCTQEFCYRCGLPWRPRTCTCT
ncbi:hypothetical protein DFP72DRAFT_911966 [Ephemerocybe angulata]|uniref:RBR-type E3 ubiquitin transferase n=1 Tax=Ephemerocybe angulata TaxID=980116 RepID=A0A8H6M1J7_9AGAR|nr:hypothetical protein DFP72DRAFT_911966 [Tulosesus angulatus]